MKLISKLANEYQLKAWKETTDEWSPRGAYEAGFRKAREMASECANRHLLPHHPAVVAISRIGEEETHD